MHDDVGKRAPLGFDARLDPTITAPLSVDTHVWPSWCRDAEREWAPPGHAPRAVAMTG